MSQPDDFLIPTTPPLSGAAMVADINASIEALKTAFKGPTAPPSAYRAAGMLWLYDGATPWELRRFYGAGATDFLVEGVIQDPTGTPVYVPYRAGTALGTAANVDTGTAAGEVPQNSHLGSAAYQAVSAFLASSALTTTIDTSSPSDSEVPSEKAVTDWGKSLGVGIQEAESFGYVDNIDRTDLPSGLHLYIAGATAGTKPTGFNVGGGWIVREYAGYSTSGSQAMFVWDRDMDGIWWRALKSDNTWGAWKRLLTEDDAAAFTEFYESSEQSMTAGGLITVSHGLGGEPTLIRMYFVCTSAEGGYSVGDKLDITAMAFSDSGGGSHAGLAPVFTSSDIQIRCGTDSIAVAPGWDDGNLERLSFPNWNLVVQAWR